MPFQEKPCMLARDNENLSMVSPPYKLKMFTGSVCVLLTIVSLKLIKINNKINSRNHEFVRKKQNGGWKLSDADWFYFSFYDPSWSESNFILFFYFFIWSESIRVDPTRTGGPSWSGPTFVPAWTNPQFVKFLWVSKDHLCYHNSLGSEIKDST